MADQPLIKDASTVLEGFFSAMLKKDNAAILKMFAPSGTLTDLEQNTLRGPMINSFFRDWPPRNMNVKIGRQVVNGQSAEVTLNVMGGGFSKPTDAKFNFLFDEKFLIKSLRIRIGS